MTVGVVVDNHLDMDGRVLKEINMLCDLGFDVKVLCFSFGSTVRYPHFEVHRLSLNPKIKDILFFFNLVLPVYEWYWTYHLKRFLRKHAIDVIHTHDLYMSRPVYRANKKRKRPIILDLHENYPVAYSTYNWTGGGAREIITRPKGWIKKERKYLNYADAFVFLSRGFQEKIYARYPELEPKPHLVLPNFPDTSIFDAPTSIIAKPNTLHLLYFGVVAERRGILDVMEVFADVVKQRPGLHLEIIGPVDKKDKSKFDRHLNEIPSSNVNYLPWGEMKDLPVFMNRAHVGLAPFVKNEQHESGLANKIFQYMYGELALLVSDCKPQKDLVVEEKIGLYFSNKTEMRDAILYFSDHLEETRNMGVTAKKVLSQKFSKESYSEKLLTFYESVGK